MGTLRLPFPLKAHRNPLDATDINMFAKIAILACTLAVASAGFLAGESAAYESYAPVATYAAAVPSHTTYTASPLSKYATYAAAAPIAHATYAAAAPIAHATYAAAAPVATYAAAAPVAHATYAAPVAHATYAAPLAQASYAAPLAQASYARAYPASFGYSGLGYSSGLNYAAGHGYGYGARSAHPSSLLGVAYSPAISVSHATYSSPIGANYAW